MPLLGPLSPVGPAPWQGVPAPKPATLPYSPTPYPYVVQALVGPYSSTQTQGMYLPNTAGNAIIVAVQSAFGTLPGTVTDTAGNSYRAIRQYGYQASLGQAINFFIAPNIVGFRAGNRITTSNSAVAYVLEVANLDKTGLVDSVGFTYNPASTSTPTISTLWPVQDPNAFVVSAIMQGGTSAPGSKVVSASSPYVIFGRNAADSSANQEGGAAYKTRQKAAPAVESITWTLTNANATYAGTIVAFASNTAPGTQGRDFRIPPGPVADKLLGPRYYARRLGDTTTAPITGVTLALTQQAGTAAVGALGPTNSVALAQAAGTGATGVPVAALACALTQAAGADGDGTLGVTVSLALSQALGTAADGTLTAAIAVALTGVSGSDGDGVVTVSGGLTLALTGVSGTGAVGTLTPSNSVALAQALGTAADGALTPTIAVALSQSLGTGAIGTASPTLSIVTTQAAGTAADGALGVTVSVALSQALGTAADGNVTAAVAVALSQALGTAADGVVTPALSIGLTQASGSDGDGVVTASVGGNTTLALTGVTGTGAVGVLTPTVSIALTQSAGAGAAGTVVAGLAMTAAQAAGTGATGTTGVVVSVALTQDVSPGVVGTVYPPAGSVSAVYGPRLGMSLIHLGGEKK